MKCAVKLSPTRREHFKPDTSTTLADENLKAFYPPKTPFMIMALPILSVKPRAATPTLC